MSYQAVLRDTDGTLIQSSTVGLQLSIIIDGIDGDAVYVERHTTGTNRNGLISIYVGAGQVQSGSLEFIDWSRGPYFFKTETDPEGGTQYSIEGISQILSVPYSLHARTSDSITKPLNESDPVFLESIASGISASDTMLWNSKLSEELDGSTVNELQVLSISNDTLFLSDGGFVSLPQGFDGDFNSLSNVPAGLFDGDDNTQLTENQVDSLVSNNGYLLSEVDGSVTNELQLLTIGNDTIYLSSGGFVVLPPGFDGNFPSLTNIPAGLLDGDDDTQLTEGQVDSFVSNNGYLSTEVDGSVTNELQVLSIGNDTIYLSGGGFVVLPAGFDGNFSSLNNIPVGLSDGDDDTQLSEAQVDNFTSNNGYLTSEIDGSVSNEIQALSLSNDTIFLSNGGFVKLPPGFDGDFSSLTSVPMGLIDGDDDTQLTEAQVDGFVNNNGYLTSEVDGSTINELQTLSISNDSIFLSNGGFVVLPSGFDGDFSSLNNVPLGLMDGDDDTQLTEAQVDGYVNNNGYLTSEIDGSVSNEIQVLSKTDSLVSLSLSGGSFVDQVFDGDSSSTNELQTISVNGDSLILSSGGSISLPELNSSDFEDEICIYRSIEDPTSLPATQLIGSSGQLDNGYYKYLYLYTSFLGGHSKLSPTSSVVQVSDNTTAGRVDISISGSPDSEIDSVYVYRQYSFDNTVFGDFRLLAAESLTSGQTYNLVDTFPNASIAGNSNPPSDTNNTRWKSCLGFESTSILLPQTGTLVNTEQVVPRITLTNEVLFTAFTPIPFSSNSGTLESELDFGTDYINGFRIAFTNGAKTGAPGATASRITEVRVFKNGITIATINNPSSTNGFIGNFILPVSGLSASDELLIEFDYSIGSVPSSQGFFQIIGSQVFRQSQYDYSPN